MLSNDGNKTFTCFTRNAYNSLYALLVMRMMSCRDYEGLFSLESLTLLQLKQIQDQSSYIVVVRQPEFISGVKVANASKV